MQQAFTFLLNESIKSSTPCYLLNKYVFQNTNVFNTFRRFLIKCRHFRQINFFC